MFGPSYDDWNHKRVKAIIDHYGHKFFFKKTILDLGGGQGEIASQFSRLGADITIVDARKENLDMIKKLHPHIRTIQCNLENEWPNNNSYDIIFSLGLLCHLKNYERHLENICIYAEHIILETEVLDSNDPDLVINTYEDKIVNDLSFGGEGSILTSLNIEKRLANLGATFKRIDEVKLNSHSFKYDWQQSNTGKRNSNNRRMWFAKRDKFLAQQFANNRSIKFAEEEAQRQTQDLINQRRKFPAHAPQARKPPPYTSYSPPAPPVIAPPSPPSIINPIISSANSHYFIHTDTISENISDSTIRLYYIHNMNTGSKENIDFCMQKNLNNKNINTVVIDDLNPTFDFIFNKINEVSGQDDINIICTSCIFFDDTLKLSRNIKSKQLYALTSWNLTPDGDSHFNDSPEIQNTWIVRGKIENIYGNFEINKSHANNRIAYEFHKSGFKVLNPSKSIKTYTNSDNITHDPAVPGPYLFIIPSNFISTN